MGKTQQNVAPKGTITESNKIFKSLTKYKRAQVRGEVDKNKTIC